MWNLAQTKALYREFQLNVEQLPLGTLKIERVKKSQHILSKIQKVVMSQQGKSKNEEKLEESSLEYIQVLPYDFGVKKPPTINHLLRVHEQCHKMEALSDVYALEQALLQS